MDVLVDLSEPKVCPKKHFATTRKFQMSTKENQNAPKLIKQSCATGILIDFSDPDSQPEKNTINRADDQSLSSDYSKTPDKSNMSESQLIYLEGPGFDISPQPTAMSSFGHSKSAENSYPALSPLNAHQMAEIFEQANTIAVRIELANARQHPCSANTSGTEAPPVGDKENDQFSPEDVITDEHLKAATSTPAKKVVPDVNAHFLGAESEKRLCLEMDEKTTVAGEQPTARKQIRQIGRTISMKQPSTYMNQGKTLIGRAPSQRTAKAGVRSSATTLLTPKTKTDSPHDSGNSTASSSTSDTNVLLKAPKTRVSVLRPCGSTQPKNDADRKTSDILTRSLDTPSVPTGRLGMRRPSESMEMLAEKKKALVLKPSRNLPPRPPGRLEKKEIGVERGTNPPRVQAVNKLQSKQSIPRKVGNQITAAGKSGNQSEKL